MTTPHTAVPLGVERTAPDLALDRGGTVRLYRLAHIGHAGYDEADGFVVAAPDESAARATPRAASLGYGDGPGCGDECSHDGRSESPCAWQDAAATTCSLIGVAAPDVLPGVVLRSYRAG